MASEAIFFPSVLPSGLAQFHAVLKVPSFLYVMQCYQIYRHILSYSSKIILSLLWFRRFESQFMF